MDGVLAVRLLGILAARHIICHNIENNHNNERDYVQSAQHGNFQHFLLIIHHRRFVYS